MDCKFCEELENAKKSNKILADEMMIFDRKLKTKYKVALVEIHRIHELKDYKKAGKLMKTSTFTHAETYLYYCPMCGRKLK